MTDAWAEKAAARLRSKLDVRDVTKRPWAVSGYQRSDLTYSAIGDTAHDDALPTDQIYMRKFGNENDVIVVNAVGYSQLVNNTFWLDELPNNQWDIYSIRADHQRQAFGAQASQGLVGPIRYDTRPEVVVGPINTLEGKLTVVSGLQLTVQPFPYIDSAGVEKVFDPSAFTVTVTPPAAVAGVNQKQYQRLSFNPTAGAEALVMTPMATSVDASLDLYQSDADTITTPAGNIPLWDIIVVTGDTTLRPYVPTPPSWINRQQRVSSSTPVVSGAPSTATYITQTPDATLSAEQALSALATGYMKSTTGTGVVTTQAVPIPITDGGTGGITAAAARTALGLGTAAVENTPLVVSKGGTGATTLAIHAALIGNGTGVLATLAPGTARNVEISDGTDWTSRAIVAADLPNTTVTPGSYTNANVTFDAQGRATAASSGGSGTGPAIGGSPATNEGRLSLTSNTPVTTADVTAAATLYWTPNKGNLIGLYDGAIDQLVASPEVSITLAGLNIHTFYDVFGYYSSGNLVLELLAWTAPASGAITGCTNASPPVVTSNGHGRSVGDIFTISGVVGSTGINGTFRLSAVTTNTFTMIKLDATAISAPGAYTSGGTWVLGYATTTRATAVDLRHAGYLCKNGDATRRFLGTVRMTNVSGQSEDSAQYRFLWNNDNRIRKRLFNASSGSATYTLTVAAGAQEHNNNFNTRAYGIAGLVEDSMTIQTYIRRSPTGAGTVQLNVGLNGSTQSPLFYVAPSVDTSFTITANSAVAVGLNRINAVEQSISVTVTLYNEDHYVFSDWPC